MRLYSEMHCKSSPQMFESKKKHLKEKNQEQELKELRTLVGKYSTVQTKINELTPDDAMKITKAKLVTGTHSNAANS